MNHYKLFLPVQAVGASLVYFDLFVPTTTQHRIDVLSVRPIVSGAVAVTGVVAADLHLTRTTAVGTGGTAATFEGTALDAATITAIDSQQPLTAKEITARLTPTGGATAGAWLGYRSLFSEETNAGTYTPHDLIDVRSRGIFVKPGTGLRVVQGAVASVGNVGFDILFSVEPRT